MAGPNSVPAKKERFGPQLGGVSRCPHCGIANPTLNQLWTSDKLLKRATEGPRQKWAVYGCTSCGGAVLAKGVDGDHATNAEIAEVIPVPKRAHDDIPANARKYLQQAYETMHAPDAAAMVAGSAVDAMLKELGYGEGNLYSRIDKAGEEHKLTQGMGDWAHEVRLGSNRPRHADKDRPHVSPKEAKQSVEFVEALGYFLFVLTKRIERGTDAAKKASDG
jgi:hypothetical protein